MAAGETKDIPGGAVLQDLLSCGYVAQAEEKAVKPSENKRSDTGHSKR